jgi:hypothetical protein
VLSARDEKRHRRTLWTRFPRLFAIELHDPATGARIQIGEPDEADAIRELLRGDVPELSPAIHRHYALRDDGESPWRFRILRVGGTGTLLVARTGDADLASRVVDYLERRLEDRARRRRIWIGWF